MGHAVAGVMQGLDSVVGRIEESAAREYHSREIIVNHAADAERPQEHHVFE
jgi:hypothetical protein